MPSSKDQIYRDIVEEAAKTTEARTGRKHRDKTGKELYQEYYPPHEELDNDKKRHAVKVICGIADNAEDAQTVLNALNLDPSELFGDDDA
ncbi:hypothetical protein PP304_gp046 [Gordonia phage Phendrix]|uniref:Uncharacterized protein n=2 Tax=Godonkavirus TaxID=2733178 RepID=A0A4D6E3Y1_9CAUD|nr:hypothetical protein HOV33_gp046 [Gordonia phage GodonK]YP_010649090.1 hypothetical protein PP304_gp046 [Gordonia phage Phendrix]QBZ72665.1 hypothetical protein SEA_GODONK_46 [Gordonia phage GodonK]QDK02594.1 hypothetical protein SEA_PHENDRIX_46 [Gordonia phage Phendrix]